MTSEGAASSRPTGTDPPGGNGKPWLDIPDVERVRWMVGPAEWSVPGSETSATPTANA